MIDFIPKGTFSWERPIEQAILEFTRSMASQMESVADAHDNKGIREGARNMATAYRTVEKQVLQEIKIRERIKK